MEELHGVVAEVAHGCVTIVRTDWHADHEEGGSLAGKDVLEASVPLTLKKIGDETRGFIPVAALRKLQCEVAWDGATKTVRITA